MRYLFILCLFYSSVLTAQEIVFKKAISHDTLNLFTPVVEPVEDGYLIAGTLNAPNNYRALYLKKLDLYGNEVWMCLVLK